MRAVLTAAATDLPIADGAPLVLAVSGGPDSMALLHAATGMALARAWQLVVAHLDHGLRPDSASDATFVTDAADALALPWRLRRADVGRLAAEWHQGHEEAGRRARYAFLEEVAEALAPDALVATAHTADDAAETVLFNLARGGGLRGVRGMPARRGRIVRPLLTARRADLRAALDAAGLAYRLDPSNQDRSRSRARIRAEVLPALEAVHPGAVAAIGRYARLAAADDAWLDALAAAEHQRRLLPDGSLDWRHPPADALARRVLRRAIGEPAPSLERLEAVLDTASTGRGGTRIELGGGRWAEVRQRRIRIGPTQ